ncbi:collagen alpha-5(VI) chain [Elysia marginata]|uniref:Collagen alpha-5(VI) chain n=1 Tax=Elysia marginata TaxID=1093978 RepID=A0AAV4HHG2_9GAST|nr:collagen alpha-5(VI) chain [Elysia marginata]
MATLRKTGDFEVDLDLKAEEDPLYPADIVFINDASGSVGADNFQKTLRFIANVVNEFDIGPYNAQIGSVTFESSAHHEFNLNTFSNKQDTLNRVKNTLFTSGGTNTHMALDYARTYSFTQANGMRTFAAQIAIVITDGDSNNKQATITSAKRLRNEGITVFAIGVGDGYNLDELNAIATDPDSLHVFSVDNFDSLNRIKKSLQKRAREAQPAFLCGGQADVVFLIENSENVGQKNLDTTLAFVLGIANNSVIGPRNVQMGVDTFSTSLSHVITLRDIQNKHSLKAALSSVPSRGGAPNTGNALKRMREKSFISTVRHRRDVPKLAVVVTSGQSTDQELTSTEAKKAADAGITVLAIGVGTQIDEAELNTIATGDGSQNVHRAMAYESLHSLSGYISAALCDKAKQETSAAASAHNTCGSKADIVFLVDSSGRWENIKILLNFIKTFVKELEIGQDKVRVALGMFSSRPYNEFNLNRYNNTEDLVAGISGVERRPGGRDVAAAIRYMDTIMFKTANGDRPGVPNIAVIMTDGTSNNPEETRTAAALARANGINVFSLGVGNKTSRTELHDMASDPDNRHVLAVTDFTKLNSLKTAFKDQICHDIPVVLPPYVPPVTTLPTSAPDKCVDQISNCADNNRNVCQHNKAWATTNCALTCGLCSKGLPTVAPACEDKKPDCPSYGLSVCTGSSKPWGMENCKRFCGYCDPVARTVGVVNKCFYKGMAYDQSAMWDDGCAYECECIDASTGQYVCYNKCPSYFNMPADCELQRKPGKCCLEPVCKFDETYTQKEVDELCVYSGQRYRQGQMWFVGCEFECICVDAATGFYACQSKCPKYESLPSNCKLVQPPGECCKKPDCEFHTQVAQFTGNSGAREPIKDISGNTSCVDEIPDCHVYKPDMCSSAANRSFALDNCSKFCSLCDSEGQPSSSADVCIFQGQSFEQGDTWHDGCDKTCVCDDARTGYIRCSDRCPDYLNLPKGCSLVSVPGQCCRSLSCDTPGTFIGSQTENDTVGAVPAPLPDDTALTGEYPTLPPGQTHAPGQKPMKVYTPSSSKWHTSAGDLGQGHVSPSTQDSTISGSADKKVKSSALTCEPAQEGQPTTLTCTTSLENCPNLFKVKWLGDTREVATCTSSLCGSAYTSSQGVFDASITTTKSSLTIKAVSRSSPFNMETKWTCEVCGSEKVLECDKLQVYALPSDSKCVVTEKVNSEDTSSVIVTCSTTKVYPRAKCSFYRQKNSGTPVRITNTADYSHAVLPATATTPVYYRSTCSVSVSVEELGEGTHSFQGYIYPDVTGGDSLVAGITPNEIVRLTMPQASHSCFPDPIDGIFSENGTRCNCSLTSDGYPRGLALWYQDDEIQTVDSNGLLVLSKDNNSDQVYTCESQSILGSKVESTIVAKFAGSLTGSECTVREDMESGYITSVTVTCMTNKVYPRAKCSFYQQKNDGTPVRINKIPNYNHTETDESPAYYRSQCSVSVSVEELGEGTHSFQGYIYPDVTGGESLVNATTPKKTVTLTMPQAFHICSPDAIDGIFSENGTRCNCSLTSDGYPSGLALWYQDDEIQTLDSDGLLVLSKDKNADQVYTCEAVSVLGREVGSPLVAKFAGSVTGSECTVREDIESGDITSVTVTCLTNKVYPRAKCSFYQQKNDGTPMKINKSPNYSHTETNESPVYYRSQCSVSVSVEELGEGTYSFQGYIYPDVTGGDSLVNATKANVTVTLNSDQVYTCEAVSVLGREVGSTLVAKFAGSVTGSECTVREDMESGDITSVTVTCFTNKVYPRAKCSFYQQKNDGTPVRINKTPNYSHTETDESPVYYRSQCSVSVSVEELGEGTHSFQGYIYPDVTGGESLVNVTAPNATVTLSMPQASHSCSPDPIDGIFSEGGTRCRCSLTSDGYPRGLALWYQDDEVQTVDSKGVLMLTKGNNSDQVYTCEAVSVLGRKFESSVVAKFAASITGSECTVREDIESGDITSVTVTCFTNRVYPRAKCSFYQQKNDDTPVRITKTPNYNHTETDESPAYYRSQCSATMAQASHSCSPDPIDGILSENGTRCKCSLTSDGYPRGLALWYKDDEVQTVDSDGLLVLTEDNNSDQVFTCEAVSVLGRKIGSTLVAKFAASVTDPECTNGTAVRITKAPNYNHTEIDESPAYYRSQCSVSVSVEEMGEGTHSFQGYIYPDVTGGESLVNATTTNKTVPLTMPQAFHSCSPDPIDGIFSENGIRCNCSLTSDGYPRGLALWYQDDEVQTVDSDGLLVLTKDNNSDQVFTCEAVSVLGRKIGSNLVAKFAASVTDPECAVSEDIGPGGITSVTVTCFTNKVYPRAKCSFYQRKNNGTAVRITKTPNYNHIETDESPAYYRSQCSVSVSVEELGEGTHSFQGYIYPDVTGGESLVNATTTNVSVPLTMPQASHSCFPDPIDGIFSENGTRCNCSLTTDGYPSGLALWYQDDEIQNVDSKGVLVLTKDNSEFDNTLC